MTKYKLVKGGTSIDFPNLQAVTEFKLSNPEWANIEPIEYEEEIIPESENVPFEVPTWRLRAILAINNLEQSVSQALDQLSDPQKTIAKRAWDYGSKTERQSPTVDFIKVVLGLTDKQVDEIFINAGAINI